MTDKPRGHKLLERDYLFMILRLTSRKELEDWLRDNPPPAYWLHGRYSWAYTEMVIGERITFRVKRRAGE